MLCKTVLTFFWFPSTIQRFSGKDIIVNRKANQVSRRPNFLAVNPNVLCKRFGFPFLCAGHNGAMHFYRSLSDDGLKSLATKKEKRNNKKDRRVEVVYIQSAVEGCNNDSMEDNENKLKFCAICRSGRKQILVAALF